MGRGDSIIRFRDGIAIAQIIVFSFSFLYAVHFRRTRRMGWFCIGGFSILRLVGAGCMLGTVKKDSENLWAGVFVCESLGILLLIFLLLEMLSKANTLLKVVERWLFYVPQVLTWIDIGISIGGFVTVARKEEGQLLPTPYSRAGIAILALIYFFTVGMFFMFWFRRRQSSIEDYWLVTCVGLCCPVLLIRLLYSVVFVITADMTWNAVKGNAAAYFCMTFLPEVAIIAGCTYVVDNTSPKDEAVVDKDRTAKLQQDSVGWGQNPHWTFHGINLRRF